MNAKTDVYNETDLNSKQTATSAFVVYTSSDLLAVVF